jgi:hypothetical protein
MRITLLLLFALTIATPSQVELFRDEIIVWDADSVWIYTQDRPFTGQRIYKPVRNPLYNDSNYRAWGPGS